MKMIKKLMMKIILRISPKMRAKLMRSMAGLLDMLGKTQDDEYSCDDAFELLDAFVDAMQKGEDAAKLMPLVQLHLELCDNCHEEFESLLAALSEPTAAFE